MGKPRLTPENLPPGDFSTAEHALFVNWINGKALFRRVIDFGALPAVGTKTIASGLSTNEVETLMPMTGIAGDGTGDFFNLNTIANNGVSMEYSKGDVSVTVGSDLSAFIDVFIILVYTKRS